LLILYLFPIALAILLLFYLHPIAHRIDLVDHPGRRKLHAESIPLIGGVAISISFFLSLLLFDQPFGQFRYLFFSLAVILIIGILDDFKDIRPATKLGAQFLVACLIVFGAGLLISRLESVVTPEITIGFGVLSAPVCIVGIVAGINAYNMVDGHDGLAGCCAVTTCLALLFLYKFAPYPAQPGYLVLITLMTLLICSFLTFNFPFPAQHRYKVFLGDAGSMFLGLFVTYFIFDFSSQDVGDRPIFSPATALLIFGLPLADLMRVAIVRLIQKRHPFRAGRDHLHHLLLDAGLGTLTVLLTLISIHLAFLLIAILGISLHWPDHLFFWLFLSTVLLSIAFTYRKQPDTTKHD